MKRLHPPIHLLKAFVATARQSSISRAAEELHLTQSTVSKQVLELESMLDVALFERIRSRLVLAPAGHSYLVGVSQALGMLEVATLDVMANQGRGGVLTLSTLPTFGAKWLIPRLASFHALHPEVSLNFVPFTQGYDFALPALDCAIRYGEGTWPGATSHYLMGRELALIAPPNLVDAQRLKHRSDISKHILLRHVSSPMGWVHWCQTFGVEHPSSMTGPKLDQVTSIVHAVMAGLGLGLVPRCLVQEELDRGLVINPFLQDYVSPAAYYLCYPEYKTKMPVLQAFRNWLMAQLETEGSAKSSLEK